FTVTALPEAVTAQAPSSVPLPAGPPPVLAPATDWRRRNRLIAAVVCGVMLLMSGVGLTYALMTQDFRRHNDTALPRKARKAFGNPGEPPPLPEGPLPPARLDGLAYLPTSTNVLAGLDVGSLRGHPQWGDVRRMQLRAGQAALAPEQLPV